MDFWKRMLVYAKLAAQSHLEYRLNSIVDWCVSPFLSTIVELAMWWTMFAAMGVESLGGFSREHYLSYITWSVFFSRITANWMYEFRMIREVDSGSINSILVRPIKFYEFYLGQFMGYKILTIVFSIGLPLLLALVMGGTTEFMRLPAAVLLILVFLVFTYTLSFCISTLAFYLTKVGSISVTKNFFIWLASGEMFPLDLLPSPLKTIATYLPFSSACYIPVGYLTHRLEWPDLMKGFVVTVVWTIILGLCGSLLWRRGLRTYAGTGA